jgi:hypothetical protein
MREEVLSKRDDRERERQLAGGELVPIAVVDKATEMAASAILQLNVRLYAAGLADTPAVRENIQRLTREAKNDLQSYVRQYLERQAEIVKQNKQL